MPGRLQLCMPAERVTKGSAEALPAPVREFGRGEIRAMTGEESMALAISQADPHLIAAQAVWPQSELLSRLSRLLPMTPTAPQIASVESENAAISAALAASAAGCRALAVGSAVGLPVMLPALQSAGAMRLSPVLVLIDAQAGGLLNSWENHADAARQARCIQLDAENVQEAYDNLLQAIRIAEDRRVRLPVIVWLEGPSVSHTLERLLVVEESRARDFVGTFIPSVDLLDTDNPRTIGPLVPPDLAPALDAQLAAAMRRAYDVIAEVGQEYGSLTGRSYGLISPYRMSDADVAVVARGSVCGTVRAVVDGLRAHGVAAGMVKVRAFRPFPASALRDALGGARLRAVAVLDNAADVGCGGPLFIESAAALAMGSRSGRLPRLVNVMVGIGGRTVTMAEVVGIYARLTEPGESAADSLEDPVLYMNPASEPANFDVRVLTPSGGRAAASCRVVMLARGGQGARTASYLLSELMIELGRFAQAFPTFGPERGGPPVRAFAKISNSPIDDRQPVTAPDVVLVFDETLLGEASADLKRLSDDGILIVNTEKSPGRIRDAAEIRGGSVYTLDATGIATDELGEDRPNIAMLSALISVLDMCDMGQFRSALRARAHRLGDPVLEANMRTIERALADLRGEIRTSVARRGA